MERVSFFFFSSLLPSPWGCNSGVFFYYSYRYLPSWNLMRKFSYFLLILFACTTSLWTTHATFSYNDFVAQFSSASANLSQTEKKAYYLKVYNNMSLLAIRNRTDVKQFNLYTLLKTYIQTQIKALWSSSGSSSISEMTIPNIDLSKVRTAWLALHNTERTTKKLTSFTYFSSLEWTATTWANHLATLGKATHLRKSTDVYYSYTSIKERFINQWITFANKEKSWQPLFTENLWRGYYTCKKTDCTDDFIKAITTSRTFFMREKGKKSKPHYNAIVGNFSNIGLGVSLVGNKYYLVTHYTQPLK